MALPTSLHHIPTPQSTAGTSPCMKAMGFKHFGTLSKLEIPLSSRLTQPFKPVRHSEGLPMTLRAPQSSLTLKFK